MDARGERTGSLSNIPLIINARDARKQFVRDTGTLASAAPQRMRLARCFALVVAAAAAAAAALVAADVQEATQAGLANATEANITQALITLLLGAQGEEKVVDAIATRLSAALVNKISTKLVDKLLNRLQEIEPLGKENQPVKDTTAATDESANTTKNATLPSCPETLKELIVRSESHQACMVMWPWKACQTTVKSLLDPKDHPHGCDSLELYSHSYEVLCADQKTVADIFKMRCGHLLAHEAFWALEAEKFNNPKEEE